MFLPFTLQPQQIIALDKETIETGTVDCMCGKRVPLKRVACVWTCRPGDKRNHWFAACTRECIIIHTAQGNA
jgi:hypothetical protein